VEPGRTERSIGIASRALTEKQNQRQNGGSGAQETRMLCVTEVTFGGGLSGAGLIRVFGRVLVRGDPRCGSVQLQLR
jgi:hypothetical protein